MGPSAMQRRCWTFHGRVQGVGFRYTTLRLAGRFRVTGSVRNLPAGTVELVAQGESDELSRFLAGHIERVDEHTLTVVPGETGFAILR